MQETHIYTYFAFGFNYNLIYRGMGGLKAGRSAATIQAFFEHLDRLNLSVTKGAAINLLELKSQLEKMEADELITAAFAKNIMGACNKLDTTLDAELRLRGAYIVTPKRFETEHLLDSPGKLFGANVFAQLPRICRFDFAQACRALAFDLPTAGAFHSMRGTEGALRYYYEAIVKRNRIKSPMWGNMIEHLRKRRQPPPKTLLDHLDNMRVNFRNPTQHPEARYNIDEGQDLLALSIESVNRMVRDLKTRTDP